MKAFFASIILPAALTLSFAVPVLANPAISYVRVADSLVPVENIDDLTDEELQEMAPNGILEIEEPAPVQVLTNHYNYAQGVISDITTDGEFTRIFVEGSTGTAGDAYYIISEDVQLYSLNSMIKVSDTQLREGRTVSIFFNVFTPQAMSNPPQLTPEIVVIHDNEQTSNVKVDYFDEEGLSSDGTMKLVRNEAMVIVDTNNKIRSYEDIFNKNLLVFDNPETLSPTVQTPPVKVVILDSEVLTQPGVDGGTDITELETTELEDEDIEGEDASESEGEDSEFTLETLEDRLQPEDIITQADGRYFALYKIASLAQWNLEWNAETAIVTLRIPGETAEYMIKANATEYGYNDTMHQFAEAPFISGDRIFVEEAFINDLMK